MGVATVPILPCRLMIDPPFSDGWPASRPAISFSLSLSLSLPFHSVRLSACHGRPYVGAPVHLSWCSRGMRCVHSSVHSSPFGSFADRDLERSERHTRLQAGRQSAGCVWRAGCVRAVVVSRPDTAATRACWSVQHVTRTEAAALHSLVVGGRKKQASSCV